MQKTPPSQMYRSLLKHIFWFKILDYTVKNANPENKVFPGTVLFAVRVDTVGTKAIYLLP